MKYLCVICARKGSKGLINKNIKKLNEITLAGHAMQEARKSMLFTKIAVSTDLDKIINISKKFDSDYWFKSPKYLSKDKIGKIPVIIHALKSVEKY